MRCSSIHHDTTITLTASIRIAPDEVYFTNSEQNIQISIPLQKKKKIKLNETNNIQACNEKWRSIREIHDRHRCCHGHYRGCASRTFDRRPMKSRRSCSRIRHRSTQLPCCCSSSWKAKIKLNDEIYLKFRRILERGSLKFRERERYMTVIVGAWRRRSIYNFILEFGQPMNCENDKIKCCRQKLSFCLRASDSE